MNVNGKNLPEDKQNMLLFMMLVKQHEEIAQMNLGETPNPVHNRPEVDLKAARFAIDTLRMLREYTAGNLGNELSEYLDASYKKLKSTYDQKEAAEKKQDDEGGE